MRMLPGVENKDTSIRTNSKRSHWAARNGDRAAELTASIVFWAIITDAKSYALS